MREKQIQNKKYLKRKKSTTKNIESIFSRFLNSTLRAQYVICLGALAASSTELKKEKKKGLSQEHSEIKLCYYIRAQAVTLNSSWIKRIAFALAHD